MKLKPNGSCQYPPDGDADETCVPRGRNAWRTLSVIGSCAFILSACAWHKTPTIYDDPSAMAVLAATQGNSVRGVVIFVRNGNATLVNANLSGLQPNSSHGIHIHENGDCSARDAASAGEHFNPTSSAHGGPADPAHHSGDLGNITADSKGDVYVTFEISDGTFGNGRDSIIGRGVIVHAARDDLKSQPAGNSGARVACGRITRNPDRMSYPRSGRS